MWRCVLFLFSVFCASASWANCAGPTAFEALDPQTQADLTTKADASPFSQGLLWQVEKGGHRSYVVGTVHFPDPRLNALVDQVAALIGETDQLFLELTKEEDEVLGQKLETDPSLILLPDGATLIDELGEENWAEVAAKLKELGIPPFTAARFQPWILGFTLSIPKCATKALQRGALGLDRLLEKEAINLELPRQSLDDVDQLLHLLTSDPIDKQIADLKAGIESGVLDQEDTPADVLNLYFDEQVQLIWTHMEYQSQRAALKRGVDWGDVQQQLGQMEQALIIQRNQSWMRVLAQELGAKPSTVVVGALHFPGENGLLLMLEQSGFSVTRIPLSP